MRRDGAPFNPQFTPGSYVKTVGQAFFKLEENHFKEKEEGFEAKLTELQDQGLVDIVKRLTALLNSFELKVNQFGFLPKLDVNPTTKG